MAHRPTNLMIPFRRGRRTLRRAIAGWLAAAVMLTAAAPAFAASQLATDDVPISSGPVAVGSFHISYLDVTTMTMYNVTVDATAVWTADVTTNVGWEAEQVRQGSTIDVTRQVPQAAGAIEVTMVVHGTVGLLLGLFPSIDIGTDTIVQSVPCNPKFSGESFICATSASVFTVHPGTGPTTPYVKLQVHNSFEVTPEGAITSRSLKIGNNPVAGPDPMALTSLPQVDSLTVPCTAKAGDSVEYALEDYSWSPSVDGEQNLAVYVGMMDLSGAVELPAIGTHLASFDTNPVFDLQGSGTVAGLGTLLASNVNPTIDPLGPFAGAEGAAIAFGADIESQCPIDSYVWQFSDGTTSYGPAPKRAFADDGEYDGQVTVTDVTGLSATRSFGVAVSNLPPSVSAGPDTSVDWGRLVQFNGQATDPGSADQATLQYSWEFGDGSPSASGGASVLHSYGMPGVYGAALQVCDKDGACAGDSRAVIVTKRDTTLAYTGPLKGAPSKTVTLTADLVDEYGQPVVGRKVTFVLGGQTAIATTDSNGRATVSIKLNQKPGTYALSVSFPVGDAKYLDSADADLAFVIGK